MTSASKLPCEPSSLSPEATEQRVWRLTLVIAGVLSVGTGFIWGAGVGAGVAFGGGLAYLNFIWMRASLQSILAAAAASSADCPRQPSRLQMAKFFLRWAVIGAVIWLSAQVASALVVAIVFGLFALPLAVVAEALVHVWHELNGKSVT